MAGRARDAGGVAKAAVLAYLVARDDWSRTADVPTAVGIAKSTVTFHLKGLAVLDKAESRIPAHGGGYRLRRDAAALAFVAAACDSDPDRPPNRSLWTRVAIPPKWRRTPPWRPLLSPIENNLWTKPRPRAPPYPHRGRGYSRG